MKKVTFFAAMLFSLQMLQGNIVHQENIKAEWKEEQVPAFDELMLSWNGARPVDGNYSFYISVKTEAWSPWLLYATWGSDKQASFLNTTDVEPVRVYQDALEVLEGKKATGFQIKIVPEGSASLDALYGLHVYTNSDKKQEAEQVSASLLPVNLTVIGLSQMTLKHERHKDLCSPTSTAAVVKYLSKNEAISAVNFAQKAWDSGFDIFGNWVFNVAQAAAELGPTWSCWVERLSGFEAIYQQLMRGTPVVVSVRGPLSGSACPYPSGHLIAVTGFDPIEQKVRCMDPAFPSDDQTNVVYDLADFVQAWNRRGRVAYLFNKKIN